jgi:hypothetical protein
MGKTEVLKSEEITKDMALKELSKSCRLSKEEIDEYLEIITAINEGQAVYNLTTTKGEYLLYVKNDSVKDTRKKKK